MHCNLPEVKNVENPSKNRIVIDWLTFTTKAHSPEECVELLCMDKPEVHFTPCPGIDGYRDGYTFGGIRISYNNWAFRKDDFENGVESSVCVSMSGHGCRTFEKYGDGDFLRLFDVILDHYDADSEQRCMNITRLDVAYDDFEGIFNFDTVLADTLFGNWVSRFHKSNLNIEVLNADRAKKANKDREDPGKCIYFGSIHSDLRIRIYDKKAQQHSDLPVWNRCELQFRRDNALGFIMQLKSNDIGKLYFGVINNYLRFVVPDENDSNRRRWELAEYWKLFLQSLEAISVYVKGDETYSIEKLVHFTLETAANAIYAMIHIIGVSGFIDGIYAHFKNSTKINPKYLDIMSHFAEHEDSVPLRSSVGSLWSSGIDSDSLFSVPSYCCL